MNQMVSARFVRIFSLMLSIFSLVRSARIIVDETKEKDNASNKAVREAAEKVHEFRLDHDATAGQVEDGLHNLLRFEAMEAGRNGAEDFPESLIHSPDDVVDFAFIAVAVLFFIRSWAINDPKEAERRQEAWAKQEEMYSAYNNNIRSLQGMVQEMQESVTLAAERGFDARRRQFLKFLHHVEKDPSRYAGGAGHDRLLPLFKDFVSYWLRVFEHCSIDPINQPNKVVAVTELQNCNTVVEITQLVTHKLRSTPVQCVKENIESFQYDVEVRNTALNCATWECAFGLGCGIRQMSVKDGLLPIEVSLLFIRFTLLSASQCLTLAGIVFGAGLVVEAVVAEKVLMAVLVSGAELCLVAVLLMIAELDQTHELEGQMWRIEKESAEIEIRSEQINEFHNTMQRVTNLWRYNTTPRLENFGEIHEQLVDTPDYAKLALLEGLCDKLGVIDKGMGPLSVWMGEDALHETFLALVAKQFDECTQYIHTSSRSLAAVPRILLWMNNALGFLCIRVHSAHDLANKALAALSLAGDVSDPYVQVSIGEKSCRTATIQKDLNPRWFNEEFLMSVRPDEDIVELHVWNANMKIRGDNSLGVLRVAFRELLPGTWHRQRERLLSFKKGKPRKHGELEFSLYFANEVPQLDLAMDDEDDVDMSFVERLSEFIGKQDTVASSSSM